jgi:hypothetical protein
MIKGTAPMKLTLEFDGKDECLIQAAIHLNEGEELDSHDWGDAMGVILTVTMMDGGDLDPSLVIPECKNCGDRHILQAGIEFDNFQWEGIDR